MPIYALGDLVPRIDPDAFVHPDAVVIGQVTLGPGASVWPTAVLRADFGRIEVGARTSIQDGTILHTTEDWPTVIGSDCVVGHNAHLEGCTVEDRCLIGSGSVVLNRAVIRAGSVVGAQALVPEGLEVPARHLALGVPARPRPLDGTKQHEWIDYGVNEYLGNAKRYRDALRRIDNP
ncbi:MAG TPA: gamma carbonic anhydrase family protein [Segeticoccus sp.]|uniref:gamma carbonic anhydrase family protein n=1 Tax=Segeticoccus sp. TaxID=2706531 RepID=UPI002D7F42A0|nr:gamma carbonic anhydrase family protein [Segeticoccus sp.]HET8602249.1 gamma carbonic anhydrase family protein [Segeticoccus sp.]